MKSLAFLLVVAFQETPYQPVSATEVAEIYIHLPHCVRRAQTLSQAQQHFDHVKVTCTPTLIDLKESGYDVRIIGVNNER
jgi:predicted glycosyltransferase